MIYLIGGPPKCGKTTLAKKLSVLLKIPWISTDSLQSIVQAYTNKKDIPKQFPWSFQRKKTKGINDVAYNTFSAEEIIKFYKTQAKSVFIAVEMMTICEITDGNNLIIEGYHIEPSLVTKLQKKYGKQNVLGIFLVKTDTKKFIRDITKTSTPNDWIIARTKNKEVYLKIAEMICKYGKFFGDEAKKNKLAYFNMDNNFNDKINSVIIYLKKFKIIF
jgi:2-phosphoglycerate kinase